MTTEDKDNNRKQKSLHHAPQPGGSVTPSSEQPASTMTKHHGDNISNQDKPEINNEALNKVQDSKAQDQAKEEQATETSAPETTEADTSTEAAATPEPKETEAEKQVNLLETLAAEVKEVEDKNLRLAAEMENLRRRTEREKQDMAKFAVTNFARDILSIDDNLQRALQSVPETAIEEDAALKALCEGVEMTGRELLNVFERYGITKLDPKGEIFDPNCHQAMFEIPNPEVPAGTIMEVVATGFMIESRVLRPAMVGIAKGGEKPVKTEEKPAAETTKTPQEQEAGQNPQTEDGIDKTA